MAPVKPFVQSALPILSASEVTSYTYCPEAWFLERCGIEQNSAGVRRVDAGSRAHRQIGRETDHVVNVEHVRRVLLIAIVVLGLALLLSAAGGFTVPRP